MKLIHKLIYPVILLAGMLGAHAAIKMQASLWVPAVGIPIIAGILVMIIQWESPYIEKWRVGPKEVNIDLVHLFINGLIFPPVARAFFFGGVALVTIGLSIPAVGQMWPMTWPLWLQLILALVIGDFVFYVVHRWLLHGTDWGWRVHAVHHSSEKLYFFSATRLHPLNFIATYLGPLAPMIILGASDELVILFSVFTAINGGLQHANCKMEPGILNWFLATSDYHRWHHSPVSVESNTNYSSNLILWDVVFGTRFLPKDRKPEQVGLSDANIPQNVWDHLIAPFAWSRYKIPNDAQHSARS